MLKTYTKFLVNGFVKSFFNIFLATSFTFGCQAGTVAHVVCIRSGVGGWVVGGANASNRCIHDPVRNPASAGSGLKPSWS